MKSLIVILALWPALAWGQFGPDGMQSWSLPTNRPAFLDTFARTGMLPCDDPNTVACVTWLPDGGGLYDSKGNSWTENGTVPQVWGDGASPLYPNGYAAAPMAGAGPFRSTNTYTGGIPLSVFASPWSACISPVTFNSSDTWGLVGAGNSPAATHGGFVVRAQTTSFLMGAGATDGVHVDTVSVTGSETTGSHLVCFGWDGSSLLLKADLGATASSLAPNYTAPDTYPVVIGADQAQTFGNAFDGTLSGVWFAAEAPSDALFTAIQSRFFGLVPSIGPTLAESRASVATGVIAGKRWPWPAGVPRIGPFDGGTGAFVEGASTNDLLNSSSPATQTTPSLGTGSYTGWVEGSGSLAFTAGTATATGLPCTATSSSDCHFSITGAGTVVATVTGTLTSEQLEPQPFRTSYIATAGTVASRAADAITSTMPALGTAWCLTSSTNFSWLDTTTANGLLSVGSGANSASFFVQSNKQLWNTVRDSSNTAFTLFSNPVEGSTGLHQYETCNASGSISLYVDGARITETNSTGTGTGIASLSGTLTIGSGTNPQFVSKVKVCKSSNAGACQ